MIHRVIFLIILLIGILNAIESEDNLLKNASFEDGIPHWEAGNKNGIFISNDSFIGNKAVEYTTGGASQTTDIISDINGSVNYIFSGYYKNIGVVDGIWLGIAYLDEDWSSIGSASISLKASTEYKKFALVDNPPIGTKYLSLWTWSETSQEGKTLLDGLELYKEGINTLNHSPQIEQIIDKEIILGDNINIKINASDIDGDILTYYLKNTPNDEIYIDSQNGYIKGVASNRGTYNLKVFVIDGKGGASERSFNLKIISAPISECNILQNPSFENSLNNWSIYSSNTTLIDDPHEGLKALRIKDGGLDQLSQEIKTGIDTYQFNGYYKTSGDFEGLWLGMNFYDNEKNLLFSKTIGLQDSQEYKKFIVNATSTENTKYIQAWVWNEGGEVTLDELKISRASCYNYNIASSLPPKGISIENAPQFVVIGFDDNTKAEGIDWALDLFKDKKNADGSKARVSFYMNTIGLDEWIEDDPTSLLAAMKRLKDSSHELGNHTYNHHSDLDSTDWDIYTQTISNLNLEEWNPRIDGTTNSLVNKVGLLRENIVGFRAPFLLYNNAMFQSLKSKNFLYDCSIEDGYDSHFDGTNFRWPYQLDEGSASHNENWYGNPDNEKHVSVGSIKGLWELPNHVLMIPRTGKESKKYGIKGNLWKRMIKKIPYLSEHKITGFDYNIWSEAELNKDEFLGILKYNLDLRLSGNRAPFMLGAHTQYYTDEWANQHAPNATKDEMREVISEFIDYALSKSQVRIRPAIDIINWCNNPTPIN